MSCAFAPPALPGATVAALPLVSLSPTIPTTGGTLPGNQHLYYALTALDSSGAENGDKCAWSFNSVVTLNNGSKWKLQMEWSNMAYTAGTGFLNPSGQKGCRQA